MQPQVRAMAQAKATDAEQAAAGWAALIGAFAENVMATRQARLLKTLEQHVALLRRELRRPTDVDSERQERERGADDAEALLSELGHPAVGLGTAELLATAPAMRRVVAQVEELIARLRRGEVETAPAAREASAPCPHCGTQLVPQSLRGNYCDGCGAPPSYRCPSHSCDFDLCQGCFELAT